ncbi:bromodomain-containing protein DDB_G0270170-like [Homarus americanus]|nr:bromodomain-containing protein DDB_G0270170-like [Homarus americanus]
MSDILCVLTSLAEEGDQTLCLSSNDVEDSGKSEATDVSQSASSNLSNKSDNSQPVRTKTGNTNGNSTAITNLSKERPQTKCPAGRIVRSRFKTAASASKESKASNNSSGSMSSNTSSGNKSNNTRSNGSNNSSRNGLNSTLIMKPSNPGKKQIMKPKPVRTSQAQKSKANIPISRPSSSLSKVVGTVNQAPTNQQGFNANPPVNLPGSKSSHEELRKSARSSSVQTNKAKLHSTILNATVLTDTTTVKSLDDVFSTTMVGGLAPSGRKLDLTGVVLPELPDISAIRLDSNSSGNRTGDTTVMSSASEKDLSQEGETIILQNVTAEELEQEYLSYLQWAYIDVNSEDAFNIHLRDTQAQISFLEQLVNEKQLELSEKTQMTDLILHHQSVNEAHKLQTDLLQELVDGLPGCEEAEKIMSQELEKNLHQVKMDNLYVPEKHKQYRDQISEALHTQITLLSELETLMEPRSHQLNSTISLLGELHNTAQHIHQCENEVQQAARLAVQEASLLIGAKQMKVSACKTQEVAALSLTSKSD